MRNLLPGITCAVGSLCALAGCVGIRTDVLTSQTQKGLQLDYSYTIARSPVQAMSPDAARYEALVRNELARYGLVAAQEERAGYVLSIAYDTRPENIAVDPDACKIQSCSTANGSRFFAPHYRWHHSLTLRFFDPANGDEVYKVCATSSDTSANPRDAAPYLVTSAFAQLPFAQYRHWSVKLRQSVAGDDAPQLLSVEPVHE
jgi:hypothetical protein